jgi:hypothetical protein
MRFAEVPGGTEVTWTSVFEVPSPIASASLGRAVARLGTKAFGSLLRTAEMELTGSVTPRT